LILVPRHPERFNDVAALIEKNQFVFVRRSSSPKISSNAAVMLGDTMGELLFLFGCADCAFVGGSLIPRGGHNTLEPAAWGLPIVTGPSDFNFREISTLLQRDDALNVVDDVEALANTLIELARDSITRLRRGNAAKHVVATNRGALEKLVGEIEIFIERNYRA
jgi:3-deoxy-D-manno-octulosonic-acid transferase